MAVTVSKPALNISEKVTELKNQPKYTQQQFWFVSDGVLTDFELPDGWTPLHVFNAGSLQKEGSGDDYTVAFDGFVYTVSFAVAPTNLNDIGIIGVLA